jgi:hypothetical protein
MSTLKADTIVASDGTSPVTLTKQSAAKHFVVYDNTDASRAIQKSLNCSSLSDLATGQTSVSYANNFSDVLYTHGGVAAWSGGDVTAAVLQNSATNKNDITTSAIELSTKYAQSSSSGLYDYDYATNISHGDLA